MNETQKPDFISRLTDVQAGDGKLCAAFAVVRSVREGVTRGGDPFVDLEVRDTTRVLKAKAWADTKQALDVARELEPGSVAKLLFHAELYQDRVQLRLRNVKSASSADDGYDEEVLFGPGYDLIRDVTCRTLVFDIETVPATERRALPTTVAESLARHAERMDGDESKVMGLSPFFGKVVSIAIGDGELPLDDLPVTVFAVPPNDDVTDWPDWMRPVTEPELLQAWWALAAEAEVVVSFNGRGFDVPFLVARSLVHGIPARVDLLGNRFGLRPHLDVFRALAGGERIPGPANLDVVCWALGIESPKGQMDGSMVAPAYERGEIEKIAAYNAHDVRATSAVYQRLRDNVLSFREDW